MDLGTDGSLGVLSVVDTQRCCKEIRKKWCWDRFGGVGEGWGRNQHCMKSNLRAEIVCVTHYSYLL